MFPGRRSEQEGAATREVAALQRSTAAREEKNSHSSGSLSSCSADHPHSLFLSYTVNNCSDEIHGKFPLKYDYRFKNNTKILSEGKIQSKIYLKQRGI